MTPSHLSPRYKALWLASLSYAPLLLISLVVLEWDSAKAADAPWLAPAFIQQAFEEVALKNEYQSGNKSVRKWVSPVNISFEHTVGSDKDKALHRQLVALHLAHLAQITGHSISLLNETGVNETGGDKAGVDKAGVADAKLKEANVRLLFTRQRDWQQQVRKLMGPEAAAHLHGAVCIAHMVTNAQSEIVNAFVVIPVDQAQMHGKLVACIVEELTQILGLPNDSEKVFPSIFNDKTPQTLLSGLDGVLLKLLYSKEISPGMSQYQVKPIITGLLKQWQTDGSLSQADKIIRQGKLYPLLGL
jgi:hypothetical protein